MHKKRSYTIEEQQKVAALLAIDMTVLSISKQTGIPESTIRVWAKKDKIKAMVASIRDEKKNRLSSIADDCLDIAELAIKRQKEIIPTDKSVMSLSVAIGTMLDKYLLLNGDPTQNIKISNLADLFATCDKNEPKHVN